VAVAAGACAGAGISEGTACWRTRCVRAVRGRAILGITISHFASDLDGRVSSGLCGAVGFWAGMSAIAPAAMGADTASAAAATTTGSGSGWAVVAGGGSGIICVFSSLGCSGTATGVGAGALCGAGEPGASTTSNVRGLGGATAERLVFAWFGLRRLRSGWGWLGVAVRYDQVTGNRNVAPYSRPESNVTDFSTSLL
jgi:hypothetical protein